MYCVSWSVFLNVFIKIFKLPVWCNKETLLKKGQVTLCLVSFQCVKIRDVLLSPRAHALHFSNGAGQIARERQNLTPSPLKDSCT